MAAKAVPFATDAWIKQLGEECGNSQSYRHAAKNWEGDFYFIIEPDTSDQEPIYMYMDLYHGQCRAAFVDEQRNSKDPEFRISGPMRVWQAIAQKQMDPIKALLTRQLMVKGNVTKIMRNVRAAYELVNCITRFETDFSSSRG